MRDERTRDRSSAWTRCIANSPQGSGNEKMWIAQRGKLNICMLSWRGDQLYVAQLLFGLAAHARAERDEQRGGRRECEGGEDVIRSADGGMSHFCGVISLNGEKHLSPRGEAGPQGTHACSILWKQEGKKQELQTSTKCSVITFANPIWFNVRSEEPNSNHLHVQLPMALRSFIVKVSSMFDCLGSISDSFRAKLGSMFHFLNKNMHSTPSHCHNVWVLQNSLEIS